MSVPTTDLDTTPNVHDGSPLRDGARRYGLVSRVNHWVVGLVMLGMLGSGLALEYLSIARETSGAIMGWHKAVGVMVLIYGAWRVLWRLLEGFPEAASRMPAWQERTAAATHWLLLAAVILMPLSGLLMSLFGGRPVETFGFTIPSPGEIEWLSRLAGEVHGIAGLALVALLVLHVGGALKHHFVDRDATLRRMLRGDTTKPGDATPRSAEPTRR